MATCAAIEVEGVRVERGGKVLLRGVTFAVGAGEVCAVVGPNGCGKTTLLRVLMGYEFATRGRVRVLGEEMGACDVGALRRRLRLVGGAGVGDGVSDSTGGVEMGGAREFPGTMTLERVVATGVSGGMLHYEALTAAERRVARAALRGVGLGGREGRLWGHASSGERTRTLIARARVGGADLLLLDEPTTGLDPVAREQVLGAIGGGASEKRSEGRRRRGVRGGESVGVTQVLITHHLEDLPADPVTRWALVLAAGGRQVAFGRAREVLTSSVLSEAFGAEMVVTRRGGRWGVRVGGR